MIDETENLVLRLPREIRAEQGELRAVQEGRTVKLTAIERRMTEMNESMATGLGMAAHGNVVAERHGSLLDEIAAEIAALKRRAAELETR